jgi:hypothetical protein
MKGPEAETAANAPYPWMFAGVVQGRWLQQPVVSSSDTSEVDPCEARSLS